MYLERFAKSFAARLASAGTILLEEEQIYAYGAELLLSTFINILGMVFLSIMMKLNVSWLMFLCSFAPLRMVAGGYHASTHLRCTLVTLGVFFLCLMCIRMALISIVTIATMLSLVALIVIVIRFAPVQSINKPLDSETEQRNRKRAIALTGIEYAIYIACVFSSSYGNPSVQAYFLGVISATFSLFAGLIQNFVKRKALI